MFTKQLFSKPLTYNSPKLLFLCAKTFCFSVILTIYPATLPTHHCSLFDETTLSEKCEENEGMGFHNILTKLLRSPAAEVLYVLQKKMNYEKPLPLPLLGTL